MSNINLSSFDEVQKEVWEKFTSKISECDCKKCGEKKLKMISKWKAICEECNTKFTIKKPKGFPRNMNDKRNWKATCCECGGIMDFYENKSGMAYLCRKCSNILEV